MSDSKFTTHGDEPVEARIVAWVLGEASAFEVDELERLCEERPELAVFKRRMEAVHGLAKEAHDQKEDARWKLSIQKRSAIEELIGAEEEVSEDLARDFRAGRSGRRAMLAIAACLVMTLVVATLTWPVVFSVKQEATANYGPEADEGSVWYDGVDFSGGALLDESPTDKIMPEKQSMNNVRRKHLDAVNSRWEMADNDVAAKEGADAPFQATLTPPNALAMDEVETESVAGYSSFADKGKSIDGDGHSRKSLLSQLGSGREMAKKEVMDGKGNFNASPARKPSAPRPPSSSLPSAPSSNTNYYANEKLLEGLDRNTPAPNIPSPVGGLVPDASPAPSAPMEAAEGDSKGLRDEKGQQLGRKVSGENYKYRQAGEDYLSNQLKLGNSKADPGTSASGKDKQNPEDFSKHDGRKQENVDDFLSFGTSNQRGRSVDGNAAFEVDKLKLGESLRHANRNGVEKQIEAGKRLLSERELVEASEIELGDFEKDGQERLKKLQALTDPLSEGEESDRALMDKASETTAEDKGEDRKRPVVTDEETIAADEPYSTFSLNINDASFRVAQAALNRGEMPDPEGIKVEQFYNAVDYGDPSPAQGQPVAGSIEQTAHPVIPGRNLVRVAIKTASEGRNQGQPLRLTLLIDQSGSMAREDRRQAMVDALEGLRGLLNENDQVNVIGFSRTPRLLAEAVNGKEGQLANLVNIEANEGGTNLEEALKLGGQLAERHQLEGAQNRMVLFTDGAANLGDADPDSLSDKIKDLRQKGISFDIAGIVADGLNDDLLGEMARHGNGRYYVVGKGGKNRFAEQLAGAFSPAAENVKVQVHFNPERVGRYKLIGFEKDRLNKEDFHDDTVDAAEMAAEEAGVAIYQVETLPEGEGEIGEVSVRFRDVASGDMVERSWTIANEISTAAIDQARPSMQLATLAMMAGQKLKGGPLADAINFNDMGEVIAKVNQHYKGDPKAAEMLEMIEQLK